LPGGLAENGGILFQAGLRFFNLLLNYFVNVGKIFPLYETHHSRRDFRCRYPHCLLSQARSGSGRRQVREDLQEG
jgi:hypothetical protein